MLSGRYTIVLANVIDRFERIIRECCRRLGMNCSGTESLIYGTEVVPSTVSVFHWPGIRRLGEVSEYQLVVGTQPVQ
eukprot:1587197-Amphidinium_carterae.1